MTFYGLSSYDRCKKLILLFKSKNLTEVSETELKKQIAINIGSSQFYKTISRYIGLMESLEMIKRKDMNTYIIQYEKVDE